MPTRQRGSRYHAIEDDLWDDQKLEGAAFEAKGFFAFLCSNRRQKPSGIYRATLEQLAADTGLPVKRVLAHLSDLQDRRLIVRDGAWIFLPGYWSRQAHNPGMTVAARTGLQECCSQTIIKAFIAKYPLHSNWITNGCGTVAERLGNGGAQLVPPEQSRAEQSRAEKTSTSHPPRALPAEATWPSPEALVLKYNREATDNCPAVTALSVKRREKANRYLRQFPHEAWWTAVFRQYHASRFLSGHSEPREGHSGFQPDFDWLLSVGKDGTENVVKVHDGRYCDAR